MKGHSCQECAAARWGGANAELFVCSKNAPTYTRFCESFEERVAVKKECSACAFFQTYNAGSSGTCQRRAPTWQYVGYAEGLEYKSGWPEVSGDAWCGEFELRGAD
jgi:hypothetical protein